MQIGVVFPQTEIEADAGAIRSYAEGVEQLGYAHLVAYDHVVGADPAVHEGWSMAYDVSTPFHEPLVLFGYLAAISSLELVTGVLILPQRQTALVAKQVAEVDILSGGRLRLGVAIGWNAVEYQALGKDFTNRGGRIDHQVALLRQFWTEHSVTQSTTDGDLVGVGIRPLPIQRPVPIWMGGMSDAAYRRIGRLADGWFPRVEPGPQLDAARDVIADAAERVGRDPAAIGMEAEVSWTGRVDDLVAAVERWRSAGATHLSVSTMGANLATADAHVQVLADVASSLGRSPAATR
jgi:probable F420-dependent oxidoreductase